MIYYNLEFIYISMCVLYLPCIHQIKGAECKLIQEEVQMFKLNQYTNQRNFIPGNSSMQLKTHTKNT